jgi:acyl carrier protein
MPAERLQGRALSASPEDLKMVSEHAAQIVVALAPEPVEEPTGATRLIEDLGYDSLRLMELTIALEERFGVRTTGEETAQVQTLDDVRGLLTRLAAGGEAAK